MFVKCVTVSVESISASIILTKESFSGDSERSFYPNSTGENVRCFTDLRKSNKIMRLSSPLQGEILMFWRVIKVVELYII